MDSNDQDEYETVDLEPNLINLMNLHAIIYNRNRDNPISLVEGVNPRIANDTSDIQEALNDILVEHVRIMNEDPDSQTVAKINDDVPSSTIFTKIYVLKDGDLSICYSRSRYALLICGSNMMNEKNNYGAEMDIVEVWEIRSMFIYRIRPQII